MTEQTYPRQANSDDEIDLVELFHGLWTQKWLIVLVTLVFAVGAASYAFFSKPVYEAHAAVLPPSLSNIAGFNLGRGRNGELKSLTVADVYAVVTRNLQGDDARREFFRAVYLPSLSEGLRSGSQDALYSGFAKTLSVKTPDKNQPDRYTVVVEHHDPAQAAEWAKGYIDLVTRLSLDEVLQNIRREVEVKGTQVQQEIKTLREFAKARRGDRIIRLQEALVVAEALGLENAPVISGQIAEQLSAFMDGDLMYMRGSKALRAEISVLKSRTSDDPFIPSLRNLEEKYAFYEGMQLDPQKVAVARQDGDIEVPDQPIKPKKPLILALGVVLGGIFGVFIALILLMLRKRSAKT